MLALYVASLMQTLQHAVQGKTCKPWKNLHFLKDLQPDRAISFDKLGLKTCR